MQIERFLLVTILIGFLLVMGGAANKGRHRRKKLEKPHRIPDEQKLLRKLLDKYDPYARPVFNASKSVVVKFGLTLTQIADMKSRSRSPVHRKKTDEGMAGVSDKSKDVGKGRGRGRGRGRQRSLETEPSTSGVGRGRGGRGRGRGRGHSQRKNTAGGEKKTEESLRMSQLVEERKKGIKVAVDRLSEVEAKRLLGEAVYRDPSMMTKVLELTSPEELPPSPSSQPGPQPQWCICTFCREMPTNEEKRCCGKRPVNCLSQSRDEVNQVLTINVWLEQEWEDERLVWDPNDFNGLEILRIPCEKLWLPDIVLYNSADDFTTGYMKSKAMVSSTGNVFWPPPAKFRSSCKIDITFFPFDDQICELKFGSWTYDGFQVDVTNRSDTVDLENYVFSGEWQLLNVKIRRTEVFYACCKEPYPDVRFTIVIRRKTLYYLFNIIFPCLWLTILSLLGFWLPPDSGEKITLGITVLLAFSVFMLLIAENMPATSEFVPLIGIYLTVTMAMTSLSIILTVFVLQLHHVGPHQKPVPRWLRSLVFDVFARLVCMCHATESMRHRDISGPRMDEMCLSTFMENMDGSNCNGSVPYNGMPLAHERMLDRADLTNDRITNHLKGLVRRQDGEDRHQDVVNEWRFVAHVIDRLLFWIFLIAAVVSSITILVIKPLLKPEI